MIVVDTLFVAFPLLAVVVAVVYGVTLGRWGWRVLREIAREARYQIAWLRYERGARR